MDFLEIKLFIDEITSWDLTVVKLQLMKTFALKVLTFIYKYLPLN